MAASDPNFISLSPIASLRSSLQSAQVQIFVVTAVVHFAALAFAPAPRLVEPVMHARFAELLARVEPIDTTADRFVMVAYTEPSPLPIEPPAVPEPETPAVAEVADLNEPIEPLDREPTPQRAEPAAAPSNADEPAQSAATTVAAAPTVAPVVTSEVGDVPSMGEGATNTSAAAGPVLVASADEHIPGAVVAEAPERGAVEASTARANPTNSEALARYSTRASQRIAAALRYTAEMRSEGVHGNVVLAVVIADDGSIVDVRVERSSGIALIDEAAVADLRRLGRLPPPPRDSGISGRTLLLPANYSIPS
jgi:protein TonB